MQKFCVTGLWPPTSIHAHIDLRAVIAKLDLIHAGPHERNSPAPVFTNILWGSNVLLIEANSFIPDLNRQSIRLKGATDIDLS